MVKLRGVRSRRGDFRAGMLRKRESPVQESGGERITKINVVMTIEEFFYVQLNGFDLIQPNRNFN